MIHRLVDEGIIQQWEHQGMMKPYFNPKSQSKQSNVYIPYHLLVSRNESSSLITSDRIYIHQCLCVVLSICVHNCICGCHFE